MKAEDIVELRDLLIQLKEKFYGTTKKEYNIVANIDFRGYDEERKDEGEEEAAKDEDSNSEFKPNWEVEEVQLCYCSN